MNRQKIIETMIGMSIIVLFLAGCGTSATTRLPSTTTPLPPIYTPTPIPPPDTPKPTATLTPTITPKPTATPTPTITPKPTATPTPTITPKPTATLTPTLSPESLLPKAEPLCEAALSASVIEGKPAATVLTLIKYAYGVEEGWQYQSGLVPLPHVQAQSATKVHTLICIEETVEQVGTYTDGQPGYRSQWDVRLVQWPDGQVLGATTFVGDNPPEVKNVTGAAYGSTPSGGEVADWLLSQLTSDTTMLNVGDTIMGIAFSPDGVLLASGSCAKREEYKCAVGDIRVWDVATGQVVYTLAGHTDWVGSLAFSPDGQILASGSDDGMVKLWDVTTGQEIHTFNKHTSWVRSVAFSPDGQMLASGSLDKTVILWDVATGQEVYTLTGHSDCVNSVTFSPDGQILASGSWDKKIKLWDVATREEIHTFQPVDSRGNVAFSPDSKILASSAGDDVTVWDVTTQKVRHTLAGRGGLWVYSIAFSPDGQTLAAGSQDGAIRLWDVGTWQTIHTFSGHTGIVYDLDFSSDGQTLASGSDDGTVKLWDMATKQ